MMPASRITASDLAGHLAVVLTVCAGLLFLAGCSDSPQSRANTSATNGANAGSSGGETGGKKSAVADDSRNTTKKTDEPGSPSASTAQSASSGTEQVALTSAKSARKSTREITFDTVKFDIEKGEAFERSMLTPAIEKLDGQRVRVRGYMLPSFQQSGIKQFVLVRDNLECCFGPGAALFDSIIVEMVGDQSCSFSVRPIAVEGIFTVREFKGPDDTHLAIYHLDGERVR